ncbi:MarR family transcriptional regulator [Janthinobacterium sp. 17J80-10]|uniref:MarR family winged helix-turn-helix transcriptional regulator n=1 Tax=Janthinobacterium sp. 17J80-10 TaxID=2497863 RepID=UPI0010057104|nr:MarR family transcriptional regulator [Janthinobacterium sp. 17J80-10]QAU33720.1 MarR family transcriptional regulator [Janthinobacterium sp. 17J80-10]
MDNTAHPVAQAAIAAGPSLEFCLRLARAHAVLMRRLDNALSNLHGLSFSDFMVLFHLQRAPGSRLRRIDLAERLGLTASGVTRTLLPLEKLGLVARQPDPRDARVGYASITEAGQRLLADAMVAVESISQEATQSVPGNQMDAFSRLLGQLAGINLSNA